jgi:hypothetical protein
MMNQTLVQHGIQDFAPLLLVFGPRTGPLEYVAKNHALHERLVDKDLV